MPYQYPTLVGVAFASRLFREVDVAHAYEKLRKETGPELDLQYPDNNGHAQATLVLRRIQTVQETGRVWRGSRRRIGSRQTVLD